MEDVDLGHSRFGRAFAALSVAFVMVFSFFSPALALTIDTNTYTNSLNGYSVPESVTINTGETVTITVTEPAGCYSNVSWGYSTSNVYCDSTSSGSYWGKSSQIVLTGKHAGTMRLSVSISAFDGPYQEGVTRTCIYDSFTIVCDVIVVGEDYDRGDQPQPTPTYDIDDPDTEHKTLVGFVSWMLNRPGLTQAQIDDLNRAREALVAAQNEDFSVWGISDNSSLPNGRGEMVTVVSDPKDAVSILNMQRSIEVMRAINEYRATDDVFTGPVQCNPARTNFYIMAVSAVGADRASVLKAHSVFTFYENLSFGRTFSSAAAAWYNEKPYFVSVMNSIGLQSLSSFRDVYTVYDSGDYYSMGHYGNLFAVADQIMGVGYTDYTATTCYNAYGLNSTYGDCSYTIDEFEALLNEYIGLHNWDDGTVILPTNCHRPGEMNYTCVDCGAVMMQPIPLSHVMNYVPASNPTCTEDGYAESFWTCSYCHHYYSDEAGENEISIDNLILPATGHTPEVDPAVPATCTEYGRTEGSHCSTCGAQIVTQGVTMYLGHTTELVLNHAPTETESGNIAYYLCTRCGSMWSVRTYEPLTIDDVTVPPTGHSMTHYNATNPTCTRSGNIEYWVCSTCHRYFSDEAGTNEISASSVVVAAAGHDPVTDPAVAPSETATGLTEGSHCSVCGTVLVPQNVVPALGGGTTQPDPDPIITPEEPAAPGTVNMYRLYNPNSGEHFYTADWNEAMNLYSLGWNYEGIGWTAPAYSNTPVYRLYNSIGGEHHYTTSVAERDFLISLGWNDENIGWYSDDAQTVPLYRQYNPNAFANNHNYTTSLAENNWLVSIGWRAEDIGWYGVG